jgi:hypothetical protein
MANMCSNDLILLVPVDGIIECLTRFVDESKISAANGRGIEPFPDAQGATTPIFDLEKTSTEDGKLMVSFLSRNEAAFDFAIQLARAYPASEFKIDYIEPNCSHAGQIHFVNGEISFRNVNSSFWYSIFHEDIQDVPLPYRMLVEEPYRIVTIGF